MRVSSWQGLLPAGEGPSWTSRGPKRRKGERGKEGPWRPQGRIESVGMDKGRGTGLEESTWLSLDLTGNNDPPYGHAHGRGRESIPSWCGFRCWQTGPDGRMLDHVTNVKTSVLQSTNSC
jgi:hypothetical protein